MWQRCQRTPRERKTEVWYCIAVLWGRKRRGRLSVIPHQTCHRQGRLCSSTSTSCSCCWQLLLHHNLPLEPGAAGAWTSCGLVGGMDYLCLNVMFRLVNGTKIEFEGTEKWICVKVQTKCAKRRKMPDMWSWMQVGYVYVAGGVVVVCLHLYSGKKFMAIEIWMKLILYLNELCKHYFKLILQNYLMGW